MVIATVVIDVARLQHLLSPTVTTGGIGQSEKTITAAARDGETSTEAHTIGGAGPQARQGEESAKETMIAIVTGEADIHPLKAVAPGTMPETETDRQDHVGVSRARARRLRVLETSHRGPPSDSQGALCPLNQKRSRQTRGLDQEKHHLRRLRRKSRILPLRAGWLQRATR